MSRPNEFTEMPRKPVCFVKLTEGSVDTPALRADLSKVGEKHGIIFVIFDKRMDLLERDDVVKFFTELVTKMK